MSMPLYDFLSAFSKFESNSSILIMSLKKIISSIFIFIVRLFLRLVPLIILIRKRLIIKTFFSTSFFITIHVFVVSKISINSHVNCNNY